MRKSILIATMLAATLVGTSAFAQGGGGGHGGVGMGGMDMSAQHHWQIQQHQRMHIQNGYQYGRPLSSGNQLHYQKQSRDQYQPRIMGR